MAADEAARGSRRMDLNLYLGLPRAPRPRRPDLGSDLALSTPMPSSTSSSAASADAPPPEPNHPPYSPSRAAPASPPPPPTEAYAPYLPEDPPASDARAPYVPPAAAAPAAMSELPDDPDTGFNQSMLLIRPSELLGWEDRPSSSTASSPFRPEAAVRYRRMLELTGRQWLVRTRRFRSDLPPLSSEAPAPEAPDMGRSAEAQVPQEPTIDTMQDNKVTVNGVMVGTSEKESDERGKSTAMFECNICFEMASEPVVTSCGHLFCWPCLYQWLNVYSNHKECPVCKGEVTEANITPIYGRGNSSSDAEKETEDGKSPGPKIPPRPHGNRLESFRQQFHHLRPISRRLGDAHGILSSWRRLLDQQIMNSVSRFEGPPELAAQEAIDNAQHASRLSRVTTRMRARRMQREAENPPNGGSSVVPDSQLPGNNALDPPRRASSPLSQEGIDLLQRITLFGLANSERLATAVSDLRRMAGPSQFGASTSSSNPPNPEPPVDGTHVAVALAADQASNSSTMAVIQEDAAVSESAGEPSNAGSSRMPRRRGRSNTLGSLDVDGGSLHRNKRRRLN